MHALRHRTETSRQRKTLADAAQGITTKKRKYILTYTVIVFYFRWYFWRFCVFFSRRPQCTHTESSDTQHTALVHDGGKALPPHPIEQPGTEKSRAKNLL